MPRARAGGAQAGAGGRAHERASETASFRIGRSADLRNRLEQDSRVDGAQPAGGNLGRQRAQVVLGTLYKLDFLRFNSISAATL